MSTPVSWFLIQRGWAVHVSDGTQIGRVEEVLGAREDDIFNGLMVATGFFSARYVPSERVSQITEGRVDLDLSEADIESQPDEPPIAHA